MTVAAPAGLSLQVLRENLSRVVGIAERAVNPKSTLPIAANILLATDRGRLKVQATDLSLTITAWCGAKIDVEGATTVPARLFGDVLGTLPEGTVGLTLGERTLHMECARSDGKLQTMDAEGYPLVRPFPDEPTFRIPARMLARAIEHTAFAAAKDDSRPVIQCIKVTLSGTEMAFAGADGFRLSEYKTELAEPGDCSFLLPRRAAQELAHILEKSTELVDVAVEERAVQFRLTDLEIVASTVEGVFPNYHQMIPTEHRTRATFDVAELVRAVRHADVYARDGAGIIRIRLTPGTISVSGRADEIGDTDIKVDAEIEGDDNKMAVGSRYLQEALGSLDDKATLEMVDQVRPILLRPVEGQYLHVVMPMSVQWGEE